MPKILLYGVKFPIASKMLTSSIFIALLMTVNTTVLAQPTAPPIPNPSPADQTKNPIAEKLLGQWQTSDPSSPVALTFIFTPEGKLFLFSSQSKTPVAVELKYLINSTPQPMHLDLTIPNAVGPVLTIFDFTADGQLRMQIENTSPGKPRPKAFLARPTLFKKVSDSPKLPEDVKLIDPKS